MQLVVEELHRREQAFDLLEPDPFRVHVLDLLAKLAELALVARHPDVDLLRGLAVDDRHLGVLLFFLALLLFLLLADLGPVALERGEERREVVVVLGVPPLPDRALRVRVSDRAVG